MPNALLVKWTSLQTTDLSFPVRVRGRVLYQGQLVQLVETLGLGPKCSGFESPAGHIATREGISELAHNRLRSGSSPDVAINTPQSSRLV